MKVLFQSRTTLFSVPGGDTTQVEQTANALAKLDCQVDISLSLAPDVSGYDVVHLFNLSRPQEVYLQAQNAKRAGKKVVLSTIHLSYDEFERHARTGLSGLLARTLSSSTREYLKVCARAFRNREFHEGAFRVMREGYRKLQARTLAMVDAVLPNSQSELERLRRDFPVSQSMPTRVIPNGVDTSLFGPGPPASEEFSAYEGCVLCVARIEGLKNQLNLVRAARELPYKFVLVGRPAPNHRSYYNQVLAEAPENVVFLGTLEHAKLASLYRVAKVHALVSWMETTGLSSLEAAACGCNLVITNKGDQREYFQEDAFYCLPDSVESIKQAITLAYESERSTKLQDRVLAHFTWDEAAVQTRKAYQCLGLR